MKLLQGTLQPSGYRVSCLIDPEDLDLLRFEDTGEMPEGLDFALLWNGVWRRDFIVYHCSLDEEEARCLDLVLAGESIGRICQQLAAGRSLVKATARAGRMMQGWLEDGILAEVALNEATR